MVVVINIGYIAVAEEIEKKHTSQLKISFKVLKPICVKLLYGKVPMENYVQVVSEKSWDMWRNAISRYHIRIQGSHHSARFCS